MRHTVGTLAIKRSMDILLSLAILVLVWPVMLLVTLLLLVTEDEPVIFRQKRVGRDGREFTMLKFRTLPLSADGLQRHRPTPMGRFLRLSGLDELPQLWNVLVGDMSLVGPRPERPELVDQFRLELPEYVRRRQVPAGITGWAQVHGLWGSTSLRERVRYDLDYIRRWSPGLDIWILVRTLGSVARRLSARREPSDGHPDSRPHLSEDD